MIVPELADTRGKLVLHASGPSAMRGMETRGTRPCCHSPLQPHFGSQQDEWERGSEGSRATAQHELSEGVGPSASLHQPPPRQRRQQCQPPAAPDTLPPVSPSSLAGVPQQRPGWLMRDVERPGFPEDSHIRLGGCTSVHTVVARGRLHSVRPSARHLHMGSAHNLQCPERRSDRGLQCPLQCTGHLNFKEFRETS